MTIYLAIPYSFNPDFSERISTKVGARLSEMGYSVIAPITQGHQFAKHLPDAIRTDSKWWLERVLPLVHLVKELAIVSIGNEGAELIEKSDGCREELALAMKLGKPIKQVEVDANGNILTIVG